jgi:hypothetical protein
MVHHVWITSPAGCAGPVARHWAHVHQSWPGGGAVLPHAGQGHGRHAETPRNTITDCGDQPGKGFNGRNEWKAKWGGANAGANSDRELDPT